MAFKNIDLDEKILLKNKIPVLIVDENWIKLFGDVKFKNMESLKEDIRELLIKEGQLEKEYRKLEQEKTKAMKMILGISDAINNEEKNVDPSLLDEYKRQIENINEKLDNIKAQLEEVPEEIRELNFQLLKLTVDYGYKELKAKERKLKATNIELENLRENLRDLVNKKHDYEEWIDATYSFLHGMLGRQEIDRLDKEFLK